MDFLGRDDSQSISKENVVLKLKCIAVVCQITLDRPIHGGENGPSLFLKSEMF
jgi:hypothetical protein